MGRPGAYAAPATADAAGGPTAAGQGAVAIAIVLVIAYATAMRGTKQAGG